MTDSDGTRYFLDASGGMWQRQIKYVQYTSTTTRFVLTREELEHNYGPVAELFPATNPNEEAASVAPTLWPADFPPYGTIIIPSFDPEPDHRAVLAGRYGHKKTILVYDPAVRHWRFLSTHPTFRNRHEYTWEQMRREATGSFEVIGATQKETP